MGRVAHRPILAAAIAALVAGGAVVAAGAGHSPRHALPTPTTHRFPARAAYALTRTILTYGPRPAGSAAERELANRLVRLLPGGRFEPVPGGLRNVVGGLPGRGRAVVLAAHYDTTPVRGYVGANNSAAGVAAVIEIADVLSRERRRPGDRAVSFLLTDGEEAPAGFTDFYAQGLRGSKAYVSAHRRTTAKVVVLDFIALHDEVLKREQGSDPALWARLRAAARRVGVLSMFPPTTQPEVLDDHTPFTRAGIAGIDLIDFDYRCWQKPCDTLAQVSRPALADVGEAVLALFDRERHG